MCSGCYRSDPDLPELHKTEMEFRKKGREFKPSYNADLLPKWTITGELLDAALKHAPPMNGGVKQACKAYAKITTPREILGHEPGKNGVRLTRRYEMHGARL